MPKFLVPHKSGAHRVAAIALFRALLVQCQRVPLPETPSANFELQNVVRNRFKQTRHVTSYRQLQATFEAGYEAVDHLDAAIAGSDTAQQLIADLLAKAPKSAKRPPQPSCNAAERRKLLRKRQLAERPPKLDMFDRPLPLEQLSGERKVPVLFTANHIPVLRFTKPQPSSLSGYLTNRILQRQKRHNLKHALEESLLVAREEDKWDSIVRQFAGVDSRHSKDRVGSDVKEGLWKNAIVEALDVVKAKLDREKELNRVMAQKMQNVVDREQALADMEAEDRRRQQAEDNITLGDQHQKG